ncbi:MAG: hypothetical protein KA712_19305 [Myxococcales bacterium]|nr:hypothetical protein [Myxococcales bacterium]
MSSRGSHDGDRADAPSRPLVVTVALIGFAVLAAAAVGAVLLVLRHGVGGPLRQHVERASSVGKELASGGRNTSSREGAARAQVAETELPILPATGPDAGGFPSPSAFAQLLAPADAGPTTSQDDPAPVPQEPLAPPLVPLPDAGDVPDEDAPPLSEGPRLSGGGEPAPGPPPPGEGPRTPAPGEASAPGEAPAPGETPALVLDEGAEPEAYEPSAAQHPDWVVPVAAVTLAGAGRQPRDEAGAGPSGQRLRGGATEPPAPWATRPPSPGLTEPPAPWATRPPSPGLTDPPAPWATRPPSPGLTDPPAPWATRPPSPGLTAPPAPWTHAPPYPAASPPPSPQLRVPSGGLFGPPPPADRQDDR